MAPDPPCGTYFSCRLILYLTRLLQNLLRTLPTVAKVFENKVYQFVEKSSDLILCLFGFVKATKFRDLSELLECV